MTTELKDCPFCGSKPTMKHIGNDHTKSRAVEVRCSNIECRVARTDKAFRNDHAWLTAVAVEGWNRRAALAASGGNAAPGLTDAAIAQQWKVSCKENLDITGIAFHFARAIAAQSAPNAALVAALGELIDVAERCDSWESFPSNALEKARAALSAAGQEVKS